MVRQTLTIAGTVLGIAAAVHGATVTYDVLFTNNTAVRQMTLSPGTPVGITVTARVDPAEPPDTDGLALVNVDLSIDFGIVQPEGLTLDPDFASVFWFIGTSGGTPYPNGGISGIGGSQNTFNASQIQRGKGLGAAMVIATGTLQTPTTPGTYTIRTDAKGASVLRLSPETGAFSPGSIVNSSLTVQISTAGGGGGGGGGTANSDPIASFSFSPNASDALTVDFDASGSSDPDNDPLTFAWNFGDGQSGATANVSHKYAAAGTYKVVLTVSDGRGGTKSIEVNVTVSDGASGGGGDTGGGDTGGGDTGAGGTGGDDTGGGTDDGNTGGDTTTPSPVPVPMCGAGVTQTAMLGLLGLFALQLTRRRY